ncbi:NAD(P)-binding domain-containing protein [Fluviicola sp.]|uniref:NAD(P)-binding domain-containing protein n=1 Tax=Fluviicola sp. TaxID=1917219 RepID=UPI0028305192|nr:NAD(P)-binding domain-containing protein [Fluviicola sp.]MDR0801212.1 hypothetical protein [Fluviicola sp.]
MKIGIIGLGWLGLPLAKSLLSKGCQVTGTTRSRSVNLAHERFLHVTFDPRQKHFADSSCFNDSNVLVLAFAPAGTNEKVYAKDCIRTTDLIAPSCKVILLSSSGVYPKRDGIFKEEDYPAGFIKNNAAGYAELALSSVLRERLTVIRLAGLVGPNRYPVTAMSKSGKSYQSQERVNLIHQEDAIGLIEFVIEHKLWNQTINGCSTKHPLRGPFYTEMARKLGIEAPPFEHKNRLERIISNKHSLDLGYKYLYPDPAAYPIA